MKINNHRYKVETAVDFTPEEIALLRKCSASHYDGECKAAGTRGVVNGIANAHEFYTDASKPIFHYLSGDDLDLLLKICEMPDGRELYPKILEIFKIHMAECKKINGIT